MGNITAKYAFNPPKEKYGENTFPINTINNRHVPYYVIEANPPSRAWILFSHANSEDISTSLHCMKFFQKIIGCNIIGYDYVGYGRNGGKPSEGNCQKDVLAMFLMMINEMHIPQENIALMGHSIGSGPTLWLANQIQRKKLVKYNIQNTSLGSVFVISGFTSCCAVVTKKLTYIPFLDIFDNMEMIQKLKMPVFIGHGDNDEIIKVKHANKLFNKMEDQENKILYIVEDCHHNDIFTFQEFQMAFISFEENYFLNRLI